MASPRVLGRLACWFAGELRLSALGRISRQRRSPLIAEWIRGLQPIIAGAVRSVSYWCSSRLIKIGDYHNPQNTEVVLSLSSFLGNFPVTSVWFMSSCYFTLLTARSCTELCDYASSVLYDMDDFSQPSTLRLRYVWRPLGLLKSTRSVRYFAGI